MAQYKKAGEAIHLPFHFLLMIFVEALVTMGWCAYNPSLAFKVPEGSSGTKGVSGTFAHWLASHPTFMTCWHNFMVMLDGRGGHEAMRAAMSNLQFSVTSLVTSSEDPTFGWLVAAHLIMARVHLFCTNLDTASFGAPLTMEEERMASARARLVKKPSVARNDQPASRGGGGGSSNGGHHHKKARTSGSFNNNNNNRNNNKSSCPFHPGAYHPVETCTKFLALAKGVNSGASDKSG